MSASCTSRVRLRGDDDDRRHLGPHGAQLGHGHRVVGQHLEQERLELVVGPVDLVDEQHAGVVSSAASSGRASRKRRL